MEDEGKLNCETSIRGLRAITINQAVRIDLAPGRTDFGYIALITLPFLVFVKRFSALPIVDRAHVFWGRIADLGFGPRVNTQRSNRLG